MHIRGGPPMPQSDEKSSPPFLWRIYGQKGELEVSGQSLTINVTTDQTLRLHDHETGKVEEIELDQGGAFWEDLPVPARNIGRIYERFAEGGVNVVDGRLVRFEEAWGRHRLIDEMLRRWDEGTQGWRLD
jgi:predicted dehydrogenase